MPDIPVRMAFLKRMHLFRGLSDDQLQLVAEAIHEQEYEDSELIFSQGSTTDTFYIIYSGSVEIFNIFNKGKTSKEKRITLLFRGDYFGEQSLLKKRAHNASVRAGKGTLVFKIYRNKFLQFIRTMPDLQGAFNVMIQSRDLARKLRLPWLNENEVVYFLSHKHVFILYQMMVGPVLGVILMLSLLEVSFVVQSSPLSGFGGMLALLSGFLLALAVLWGFWQYVDWSNDYYVVTNQRVVRIDKVVLMYDSREESSMSTITSVNSESDMFGRVFRYGTVIVRTISGEMRMSFVHRPKYAVAMIEEYLLRAKDVIRRNDEEIMRDVIRKKIGLAPTPAPAAAATPPPQQTAAKKTTKKPGLGDALSEYIRDIFYARKEVGGTVTYHKHWIVLVKDVILQTIALIGLLSIYPLWYYYNGEFISLAFGSIVLLLIVATLVWWVYGFLDWRNDLYQVTPEQIVDIYRVPFGDEERKAAPLENILSANFQRTGFFGLLFNYGKVNIQVGNLDFDFDNVADPPSVQRDIVQRMNARIQKKREADAAAEHERMAEWLAMYHKTMTDVDKQSGQDRTPDLG